MWFKENLRNILIVSGGILLVVFLLLVGFIRHEPEVPEQRAQFEHAPLVLVCEGSQYTPEKVEEALAFWEVLGYNFLGVIYEFPCGEGFAQGAITIQLPDQDYDFSKLGTTRLLYDTESGEISLARIQISDPRSRVLEHELGHALGWKHVNSIGHIMHPDWGEGGWDNYGLEFKQKEELLEK